MNCIAISVYLVVSGKVEGFPDVALVRLSVSHQAEGPVAGLVQDLAAVGHAGSDAQALAQGPRGTVDKVQPETKLFIAKNIARRV